MRLLLLLSLLSFLGQPAQADPLRIFAAASLADVLQDMAAAWPGAEDTPITIVAAGSSVLARQIAQGAPADIYLSASTHWMDWTEAQEATDPTTRRAVAGNRLVLVRARSARAATLADLPDGLGEQRLAVALVEAVPAGIYAKQALQDAGLWDRLRPRLAETDNVRAALLLVALGEAPYGLVYATDAHADDKVEITEEIDAGRHDPIVYPAAVTSRSAQPDAARGFLDWMTGPEGQSVFARHGFVAPPG